MGNTNNPFQKQWTCDSAKKKVVWSKTPTSENWFQCRFTGSCSSHNCSNFKCTPSGLFMKGQYPNLATCQTACKRPLKYQCSGDPLYTCSQSATGTYDTEAQCVTACKAAPPAPTTYYQCSGGPLYQCQTTATTTPYTSAAACLSNCTAPPTTTYYTCGSNYTCQPSATGSYSDLASCASNCKQPKYACGGAPDYRCVLSESGTYTSMSSCTADCHAYYKCNADNSGCELSTSPTAYTDISACGCKYYACNTSSGTCMESATPTSYRSAINCGCPYYQCNAADACEVTTNVTPYRTATACGCTTFTRSYAFGNHTAPANYIGSSYAAWTGDDGIDYTLPSTWTQVAVQFTADAPFYVHLSSVQAKSVTDFFNQSMRNHFTVGVYPSNGGTNGQLFLMDYWGGAWVQYLPYWYSPGTFRIVLNKTDQSVTVFKIAAGTKTQEAKWIYSPFIPNIQYFGLASSGSAPVVYTNVSVLAIQ